ncbi:MAG: tRNA (adenosine(37)-N6)-threonylcarbamoyltransferase complex ATPase subunit type 1 TsaE [Synergistales bacterium]
MSTVNPNNRTPELIFQSRSESETREFGVLLSRFVFPGLLILLSGDLGTGKTVIVRGIVKGLSGRNVRSPSFTLVNEYAADIPVTHADLYRLPVRCHEDLGLEEALQEGHLVLVEWSQNWKEPPLYETWQCFFDLPDAVSSSDQRLIRIRAFGEKASASLEKAEKAISGKEDESQ